MDRWSPARRRSTRVGVIAPALLAVLLASAAWAGNTVHPRTPVLWPEAPCIRDVDRSGDPLFAFSYDIPKEDTALTSDELPDSRRHQFIALCRQYPAGSVPPLFVSVADLQRSIDAGLVGAELLDDPESSLETSELWAGCWARITADDERRAITFAAAAEPVVWDTSELASGSWIVAGYTWEPPFNLWRASPWVVRVVDGADPASAPAAATIGATPDVLWSDERLELELCARASPGAQLTLAWANSKQPQLGWTTIATVDLDQAAGPEGQLSLDFAAPEPTWGQTLRLRSIVEPAGDSSPDADPDATYEAHARAAVVVIERRDDEDDGSDESPGDDSDDPGHDGGADDSGGTSTDGGPGASEGGGCRLAADDGKIRWIAAVALLLIMIPRRRTAR